MVAACIAANLVQRATGDEVFQQVTVHINGNDPMRKAGTGQRDQQGDNKTELGKCGGQNTHLDFAIIGCRRMGQPKRRDILSNRLGKRAAFIPSDDVIQRHLPHGRAHF